MTPRTSEKHGRSIAYVNGAVAVVVLAVLASAALFATPPPPPSIAEFKPQAQAPIEDAPDEQAANSGIGADGLSRDVITIEEQEDGTTVEVGRESVAVDPDSVPSALACVRWPNDAVTQTFDPQSPPCIASWDIERGNGGATSVGVTPTEIRIAGGGSQAAPYIDFLNNTHQFYGRRIVQVDAGSCGFPCTPEAQVADARNKAEAKVFAALEYFETAYSRPYHDELARQGIVSVRSISSFAPSRPLASQGPHQWVFAPGLDQVLVAAGDVLCRQVVGKSARNGTQGAGSNRVLAIAVASSPEFPTADVSPLTNALAGCGSPDVRVVEFTGEDSDSQVLFDLQATGVSTVVVVAEASSGGASTGSLLTRAGVYHPEWFTVGTTDEFEADLKQLAPADQTANLFGLAPWNRVLGPGGDPATVVLAASGEQQIPGRTFWYRGLAMLAAGIQMAGPNLTPETFEAGMYATTFPNPGAGREPYRQAGVGFNNDHVMMNDYALVWWNGAARDPINNRAGTWCYVADGGRWRPGSFPDAFGFFDQASSDC